MPQLRVISHTRSLLRWLAISASAATALYAAIAAQNWRRYGKPPLLPSILPPDPILDQFMPDFEVRERHAIYVAAPAAFTLLAAMQYDWDSSPAVRSLFRSREALLGAPAQRRELPGGMLAKAISLGWGILADIPGREIVFGAVTRPWESNVTFRALPPEEFKTFHEPGYVKILWTLRADPLTASKSLARTETRVCTTSPEARRKFRLYWSFLSPGIILIRYAVLLGIKRAAQRMVTAR